MESTHPLADLSQSAVAFSQGKKQFGELDQTDFLRLLTVQLRYQDPTAPTDPQDFMQQLVQFSSVDGIQKLQASVANAMSSLESSLLLQGTALVNKQVLAKTDTTEFSGTPVRGALLLPEYSSAVRLQVLNEVGMPVRTLELGSAGAGQLAFSWDGLNDAGQPVEAGRYRLKAAGDSAFGPRGLDTLLATGVQNISVVPGTGNIQVQLASGQAVPVQNIYSIF